MDTLRIANVALSGISCTLLIATLIRRWEKLPVRVQRIGAWVAGLLAVVCYAHAEALALDLEPGLRVPAMTIVLLGLIVSILYQFDRE